MLVKGATGVSLTNLCWENRGQVTGVIVVRCVETKYKHHITMFVCNMCFHKVLTHCGLVTRYGDIEMGQHWLR